LANQEKHLNIRIDEDLKQKFIEKCESSSISYSKWMRNKVKEFVKEEENG
jgi:predicted HicB family RNase H-like nuclease